MKLRLSEIIVLILTMLAFGVGIYLYPKMPLQMASHWNLNGEVNGYMSRFWGAFFAPLILIIVFLLFVIVPRIDPKKDNIKKFRSYFDIFIILMTCFLLYLYALTLFWNFGYDFKIIQFLIPAFTVLFYYTGILTEHAEMNWSIGIRTPWTLSNAKVWKNTHQLGGKMFKISAFLFLPGMLFLKFAIFFVLFPIIFTVVWMIFYSYLEYEKVVKK